MIANVWKNFSSSIVITFLFIVVALGCFQSNAQLISIDVLKELKNDLSARTNPVLDSNDVPCALLIINSMDRITDVDGNKVRVVKKGNQTLVYLSSGTKLIKVHTLHHPSIDVSFKECAPNGLISNFVYQLDLKSDLSTEVLLGVVNPMTPVIMAESVATNLPDWWDTRKDDLYVGISSPSLDGESAKKAAILNAVALYMSENRLKGNYNLSASNFTTKRDVSLYRNRSVEQICSLYGNSFNLRVIREYYNSKGEYFVLCSILYKDIPNNKFTRAFSVREWSPDEHAPFQGELLNNWGLDFSINGHQINISAEYKLQWNGDEVKFSYEIDGVRMLDIKKKMQDITGCVMDGIEGPLGFAQIRLLSAFPNLPEALNVSFEQHCKKYTSCKYFLVESTLTRVCGEYSSVNGAPINITSINNGVVNFSVHETLENVQNNISGGDIYKAIIDNYSKLTPIRDSASQFLIGFGDQTNLFELNKNFALIDALNSLAGSMDNLTDEWVENDSYYIRRGDSKINVLPIWRMDASLINEEDRSDNAALPTEFKQVKDNWIRIMCSAPM